MLSSISESQEEYQNSGNVNKMKTVAYLKKPQINNEHVVRYCGQFQNFQTLCASTAKNNLDNKNQDYFIAFCAKLRAERSGNLQERSARAVFKQAWCARLCLAAARLAYDHTRQAVATLLRRERFKGAFLVRKPNA